MKLRTLSLSLIALAAGATLYAFQDKMQMPTPSAEHKVLERTIGTWEAELDMGAGAQPAKGTMVIERGPGGFTVISHFNADMGGMPFEGRGIDGYDPAKKKYVSIWVDSMSAAPMQTEGTWDEKTQTSIMFGDMPDMTTGKMVKHRLVTKWTGNDQMDFTIFAPGADGKETPSLKIKYTRKQK
jgi:hypothetical protein